MHLYKNLPMDLKDYLQTILANAAHKAGLEVTEVQISYSRAKEHGDITSNLALSLTKSAQKPPMEIAEMIIAHLPTTDAVIANIFLAPPGFINFNIKNSYYQSLIKKIVASGSDFGKTNKGQGQKANVEFVSANPTGPLTIGHGRQAVLGDAVAKILEWHGYEVTREYYFNDAGRQMRLLAESVAARYLKQIGEKTDFPEDGYQGEYIHSIAAALIKEYGTALNTGDDLFRTYAEEIIFKGIKDVLKNLNVIHDQFSNEKTFYETGAIDTVITDLKKNNLVYDADGATWFKTTALGMEQDRVLIKSSGEPTYRLPDIAYHRKKVEQGFDIIVDIFGSDHVDTYPDVLAGVKSLGLNTEHIHILIHQFVTLLKNGKTVKMSTRKGDFIPLKKLVDDLGVDVVRYFFIMRKMNSHLNFDLDLAADQSEKNPVYYLQYAHARICNIIKHVEHLKINIQADFDAGLIQHPAEFNLLKTASQFPEITDYALATFEPQIIANYLQDLATAFHKFYSECRVISDNKALLTARVFLVKAIRNIIANGLSILGISAPERM